MRFDEAVGKWGHEHARAFAAARAAPGEALKALRQAVDGALSDGWAVYRFRSSVLIEGAK